MAMSPLSKGMRFALTGSVVLVSLAWYSPAFGQEALVKDKGGVPGSGEVSESADEPEAASATPEESQGAAEEVAAPPASEDGDASAPSEFILTPEKSSEGVEEEPEEALKGNEIEKVAGGVEGQEAEVEIESESETPVEPAAGSATDAPPESSVVDSNRTLAEKLARARTGFVFAPRLGLTVGGATHLGIACEETGTLGCGTFGIRDHREASGIGIAADALYGLIPELRLGATVMWLPQAKGDAGGDLRRLGTEVHLKAVAEGVFDLMDRLAVTVRMQGGAAVLAPTGFVDDVVKEAQDDCEMARDAGVDCTVHDGPYFAPVFGGGAGILAQTKGAARLRLDFLFETQTVPIYEQKAASDSGMVNAKVTMDQSRFWLLGGFEI